VQREHGWRGPLLAVLALTLIPLTQLRVIAPIEQTIILLIPAIAACAFASWFKGGRGVLALIWVPLAAWTLSRPLLGSNPQFDDLARGWSLILAASFALVCCFGDRQGFLARGLIAVAITVFAAFVIVMATRPAAPQETVLAEFAQRTDQMVATFRAGMAKFPWLATVTGPDPSAGSPASSMQDLLEANARLSGVVFPALLALESLLVLAVAWALFHRLSRARIGAPLTPLREFRFSDELVWGVLLGATALLLPTLDAFRDAGWNLLVFFGGLYALRGAGVIAWFLAPRRVGVSLFVVLLFLFPFLATGLGLLGLGDTWLDWRNRVRPTS